MPEESDNPRDESLGIVKEPFPPPSSRSGKRYYVFEKHHRTGQIIAAGQEAALEQLNGSWFSRGKAPRGYAVLEEALNASSQLWPESSNCTVVWKK